MSDEKTKCRCCGGDGRKASADQSLCFRCWIRAVDVWRAAWGVKS